MELLIALFESNPQAPFIYPTLTALFSYDIASHLPELWNFLSDHWTFLTPTGEQILVWVPCILSAKEATSYWSDNNFFWRRSKERSVSLVHLMVSPGGVCFTNWKTRRQWLGRPKLPGIGGVGRLIGVRRRAFRKWMVGSYSPDKAEPPLPSYTIGRKWLHTGEYGFRESSSLIYYKILQEGGRMICSGHRDLLLEIESNGIEIQETLAKCAWIDTWALPCAMETAFFHSRENSHQAFGRNSSRIISLSNHLHKHLNKIVIQRLIEITLGWLHSLPFLKE